MPSLLTYTFCRACGHEHHFTLLEGGLEAHQEYVYFCPRRGIMTTLRPGSAGKAVEHPPQGTIVLRAAVRSIR